MFAYCISPNKKQKMYLTQKIDLELGHGLNINTRTGIRDLRFAILDAKRNEKVPISTAEFSNWFRF